MSKLIEAITHLVNEITANLLHLVRDLNSIIAVATGKNRAIGFNKAIAEMGQLEMSKLIEAATHLVNEITANLLHLVPDLNSIIAVAIGKNRAIGLIKTIATIGKVEISKWIEPITHLVNEITANPLHPVQDLNSIIAVAIGKNRAIGLIKASGEIGKIIMVKGIEPITHLANEITANPLHPVQDLNLKIAHLKEAFNHQHHSNVMLLL